MKKLLNKMRIRTKIYAGFGISLLILIAVVLLSFSGLRTIRNEFDHYSHFVKDEEAIAKLVTSVGNVQKSTLLWLRNPSEDTLQNIKDSENKAQEDLQKTVQLVQAPEHSAVLKGVGQKFDQFRNGISTVGELTIEEKKILKTLETFGGEIIGNLSDIQETSYRSGDYKVSALAATSLSKLVLARIHASKFFMKYDDQSIAGFEENAGAMDQQLALLSNEITNQKNWQKLKRTQEIFATYREEFAKVQGIVLERNQTIQTELLDTAASIVTDAHHLEEEIFEAMREVSGDLSQTQEDVSRNAIIMGLAGFILSLLGGYILSIQLTRPINAMRSSLMKLSSGDLTEQIPYTQSGDEIGDMARALQEFREDAVMGIQAYNALNASASCVMMSDLDLNINYMNESQLTMLRAAETDLKAELPNFDTKDLMGKNIDIFHKNPQNQRTMLANLQGRYNTSIKVGPRTFDLAANAIFSKNGEKIGYSVEWKDRTAELLITGEINDMIEAASAGNLNNRIVLDGKEGFFLDVSQGVNNLAAVMQNVANDLAANLQSLSKGDLTARITSNYEGIFKQLKDDYNTTSERLSEIVGNIKEVSGEVSISSDEMADSSSGLSNRAEQQASTLEETAASMEELTSTVRTNADNARDANKAANDTRTVAERGTQVANDAGHAMEKINESSRKITDIINVIDEIAFQTNLLALNAAVEAARAGDAGRGFAVVAQEVRTLAQRSAQSSKDIKALIDDSSKQVGEGVDLVKTAVESLQEIYDSIEGVTDLVGQIASASAEQATSLDELNQAVMEMDSMTQQNAAMAQQSKITAEGMQRKSLDLQDMVAFFHLSEDVGRIARSTSLSKKQSETASNITPMPAPSKPSPASSTNGVDKPAARAMAVGDQSMDDDSDWQEF